MSDDLDKQLTRQHTIWTSLYGPTRADELTATARERLSADPACDLPALFAELDPDDDDWEESGLSRPGFS